MSLNPAPNYFTFSKQRLLSRLEKNHRLMITLEDGECDGGYGQRIASFYGHRSMRVFNFGISKAFHTDFKVDELLKACGMDEDNLLTTILKNLD